MSKYLIAQKTKPMQATAGPKIVTKRLVTKRLDFGECKVENRFRSSWYTGMPAGEYYRHGGILPNVLRKLSAGKQSASGCPAVPSLVQETIAHDSAKNPRSLHARRHE